ncbi:MAG: hypothetical protein ACD_29C00042G0001 [uncultured bacterium]|nr:MAG: hypothetical protein ACD_29C00042G0001 [uncultured bacterium]
MLIAIFISSSLLDVLGIGMISVFLLLIVNFSQMVNKLPIHFQKIIAEYSKNEFIFFIGIILIFSFLFKGFFCIYAQRKVVFITSQFSVRLKTRLLIGYQNASYLFHLKQNSAYLINKISLTDSFSNSILFASLNILSFLLITSGVVLCLVFLHPIVTLFLAMMIAAIFFGYEFFAKNRILKMGKVMSLFGGEINKSVLQALGGLREVRVLGKEPFFLNKMKSVALEYSQALANSNSLQLIPRYAVESAASIFLVFLVLGALLLKMSPLNMIPTLGVFAAASIRLLPIISQLISQVNQIRSANFGMKVLYDELNSLEITYKTNLLGCDARQRKSFSQFSLDNVSFRYPNAKKSALIDLNLKIFRGKSVGLIGSSGAGKSTLVTMLLGLINPDSGSLLVDGSEISNLRAWLNNFAYIPQSIFLLDDTLKRNIAMGTEDADIDDEKINKAIEMAQLLSVVADLPDGVNTLIGENGVLLSGGQRQRVALARALYYEREIIIMDEATSSLDHETEAEVINSIKRLHGVKTLIVIAHRLSTIQYCDVVYKLDKGKIIATGSFDDVVENKKPLSA